MPPQPAKKSGRRMNRRPSFPPARATVRADLVSSDFLVEIEAIALKR